MSAKREWAKTRLELEEARDALARLVQKFDEISKRRNPKRKDYGPVLDDLTRLRARVHNLDVIERNLRRICGIRLAPNQRKAKPDA